jgi:hypothetical protein
MKCLDEDYQILVIRVWVVSALCGFSDLRVAAGAWEESPGRLPSVSPRRTLPEGPRDLSH